MKPFERCDKQVFVYNINFYWRRVDSLYCSLIPFVDFFLPKIVQRMMTSVAVRAVFTRRMIDFYRWDQCDIASIRDRKLKQNDALKSTTIARRQSEKIVLNTIDITKLYKLVWSKRMKEDMRRHWRFSGLKYQWIKSTRNFRLQHKIIHFRVGWKLHLHFT